MASSRHSKHRRVVTLKRSTTAAPFDDVNRPYVLTPLYNQPFMAERIHRGWTAKAIGTARCDPCDKQSRGVVQKCDECGLHVCFECSKNGVLNKNKRHFLDHDAVCWDKSKLPQSNRRITQNKSQTAAAAAAAEEPARRQRYEPKPQPQPKEESRLTQHKATQTPASWPAPDEEQSLVANILVHMPRHVSPMEPPAFGGGISQGPPNPYAAGPPLVEVQNCCNRGFHQHQHQDQVQSQGPYQEPWLVKLVDTVVEKVRRYASTRPTWSLVTCLEKVLCDEGIGDMEARHGTAVVLKSALNLGMDMTSSMARDLMTRISRYQ